MGRFEQSSINALSFFATSAWTDTGIEVVPENFSGKIVGGEYVRATQVMAVTPINRNSTSGLLQVDIFVEADKGPKRGAQIADLLDLLLSSKTVVSGETSTQFGIATVQNLGYDQANPSLYRYLFSVPFNHFGVI